MQKRYPNFVAYIDDATPISREILIYIRSCVKKACPEAQEEFKWNFPNFTYKGSILCFMAAFKHHAIFGFWLGDIMDDPEQILSKGSTDGSGMGAFWETEISS